MVRLLRGVVGFFFEPAFIELKSVLLAYLFARGDWGAAVVGIVGFFFIMGVMNVVAYFEGAKSLWSIYWIVRNSEKGVFRIADIIPDEVLVREYGYLHRAFRFGPFAQNAGNMKILYDSSGHTMDYQCGFNMLGNSYLITASSLSLDTMPVVQKYLAMHEIGHGSTLGGVIWISAIWVMLGGVVSCIFGLAVANITWLGIASIAVTLLVTVVYSQKLVVESAAETFADGYAIIRIARGNPDAAVALIRELLKRIADSEAFLSRYDCLINKSRAVNLTRYLHRLERKEPLHHLTAGLLEKAPHYVAAIMLFSWVLLNSDTHHAQTWLLAGAFVLAFVLTITARNHAVRKMLSLDTAIQKLLEGSHDVA
jgi:hypothetical protein